MRFYAPIMEPITLWRDVPVIEAILRLTRTQRVVTPRRIADEAVLHLNDVYDSIAHLVAAGYVAVTALEGGDDVGAIAISLTPAPFRSAWSAHS